MIIYLEQLHFDSKLNLFLISIFITFIQIINKNYSSPQHNMYPYYRYLSELEAENAFRKSRLEADLALSRAATEAAIRRSRIDAQI